MHPRETSFHEASVPKMTPNRAANYISRLPQELLISIIEEFLLADSPRYTREKLKVLSLVCREWNTASMRLSCISISFVPKSEACSSKYLARLTQKLKSDECASCLALYVDLSYFKHPEGLDHFPFCALFELVAPTVHQLELVGPWDDVFPRHHETTPPQPITLGLPFEIPKLRELRVQGISWSDLRYVLHATCSDDKNLVLSIHHDFETHKERHLFSIQTAQLLKDVRTAAVPNGEDKPTRYLDLYLGRLQDFTEFVESMGSPGQPTDPFRESIGTFRVWLKNGREIPKKLDMIFEERRWRPFIQFWANEPDDDDFCHPNVCRRLYTCPCQGSVDELRGAFKKL